MILNKNNNNDDDDEFRCHWISFKKKFSSLHFFSIIYLSINLRCIFSSYFSFFHQFIFQLIWYLNFSSSSSTFYSLINDWNNNNVLSLHKREKEKFINLINFEFHIARIVILLWLDYSSNQYASSSMFIEREYWTFSSLLWKSKKKLLNDNHRFLMCVCDESKKSLLFSI